MRALLLTSQRTGSTFLTKCLNAHSLIRCDYAELFMTIGWRDYAQVARRAGPDLEEFYSRGIYPARRLAVIQRNAQTWRRPEDFSMCEVAPVMVAKVMINQILGSPSLHRYVMAHQEIRVIHLRRRNLLKQHVSNMLNKQRSAYARQAHTTAPVPPASIEVNPNTAVLRMRATRYLHDWYDRRLACHPRLTLYYEDMFDEQGGLAEKVSADLFALLEVPAEPLHTDLVKINPDDLHKMVANYDELAGRLKGTEFERYLD